MTPCSSSAASAPDVKQSTDSVPDPESCLRVRQSEKRLSAQSFTRKAEGECITPAVLSRVSNSSGTGTWEPPGQDASRETSASNLDRCSSPVCATTYTLTFPSSSSSAGTSRKLDSNNSIEPDLHTEMFSISNTSSGLDMKGTGSVNFPSKTHRSDAFKRSAGHRNSIEYVELSSDTGDGSPISVVRLSGSCIFLDILSVLCLLSLFSSPSVRAAYGTWKQASLVHTGFLKVCSIFQPKIPRRPLLSFITRFF